MGKKQREKKERQAQRHHPQPVRPGSRPWLAWLVGVLAVIVVLVGVIVYYVQSHKVQLAQAMIFTTAQKVQSDLSSNQAQFSLEEARQLQDIVMAVQRLAGEKELDLALASHLNFMLQVSSEIVKNGNLEPGELDKLSGLLMQAQQIMENKKRVKSRP